jgi:hypothetical protein
MKEILALNAPSKSIAKDALRAVRKYGSFICLKKNFARSAIK